MDRKRNRKFARAGIAAAVLASATHVFAEDVSAQAFLQIFEASYKTLENRAPDIFAAGYGALWIPPVSRADSGNLSVGYDVYDRFDLGSAGNSTMYGSETGLKKSISVLRRAGTSTYVDLVWNHQGYSSKETPGFVQAGAYPGITVTLPSDTDGDLHPASATGDHDGRLAGLLDIAQEKNHQFIRNPVTAGNAMNIPAGTISAYGRLANVPTEANRRFYPNRDVAPARMLYDPATGQMNIPVYDYSADSATTGDPVAENALGYLMRNTQWLVQEVGVDGFRVDAAKHMPTWVMNYLDRAVYRSNPRLKLDGSVQHVFSFSEVFDGNKPYLQSYIRKDINPAQPGTVGGNRDVLDFPLYFAMRDNLTSSGLTNNWNNIINASQDSQDDGLANNGSQGVAFVQSHDGGQSAPHLSNVAYAYTLMRPGNSIVYFNAKEFGDNRSFPIDGRGDALGGQYGDTITKLVNIRNTHGRGNYAQRYLSKESLIYEREKSALVVLSNRSDGGYDSVTIPTGFASGTRLIELTGNAANSTVDPFGDFSELLVVNAGGNVNLRIPRNKAPEFNGQGGAVHNKGYFIYGLPTPVGTLSASNVASTIAAQTQNASNNGTARISSMDVITANSFTLSLNTSAVTLSDGYRDLDADGDNALFKVNSGLDLNGNGTVDFRGDGVVYGFEQFVTQRTPGYGSANGNGTYSQSIDTTSLPEGMNFITVRAFRHRNDGGPAVYTDFRKTIYVDRLKPVSEVKSFLPWDANTSNRDLTVASTDQTADSVHLFLNLGAALTDSQVLALVGSGNKATQIDRDQFKYGFFGVDSGNNVATIVTYEISGNVNVQRIAGIALTTNSGSGLGDTNFDNQYTTQDITGVTGAFEQVLYTRNGSFNPAADMNADGKVDTRDMKMLEDHYWVQGATPTVKNSVRAMVLRRGNFTAPSATNAADIDFLRTRIGAGGDIWSYDLDVDGSVTNSDVDWMIHHIFHSEYGDANLDGRINTTDFNVVAGRFGMSGGGFGGGDFNGSGAVDSTDFVTLVSNYGFFYSPPTAAQQLGAVIPEPASVGTLLAVTALLRRRRN